VGAEGDVALDVGVVRVRRGQVPERRFGLDVDEVLVVVDLEERLGRVGDLPDDDRCDLDRVAVVVVDLELGGLEVADLDRDLAAHGERVDPVETLRAHGSGVVAEEDEGARLVGADRGEPAEGDAYGDEGEGDEDDPDDPGDAHVGPCRSQHADDVPDHEPDQQNRGSQEDEEGGDAGQRPGGAFLVHRERLLSRCAGQEAWTGAPSE
jgi:hypothetical protein